MHQGKTGRGARWILYATGLLSMAMVHTSSAQITSAEWSHSSITQYDGPSTCVRCHTEEALEVHGSVHYQQSGPTDYVTNIDGPAGERGPGEIGINTYCGTHENSPRFTCAGCHVGNGRFPKPPEVFASLSTQEQFHELSNIDCLTCHQQVYKRFPDWTENGFGFTDLEIVAPGGNGKPDPNRPPIVRHGLAGIPAVDPLTLDFDFLPAGIDTLPPGAPLEPMPITTLAAAQTVHPTTRQSCLNCHAGAAGGDGVKRGDISSVLIDPPRSIDIHMSSRGEDMTCSDCHDAGAHRVRGRGLDLRPNDVPERFTCETSGCHSDRPHDDYSNREGRSRDKHATRVACQTCHIPTYAKGVPTEVQRDWQDPHFSDRACNGRGGWLPREDKAINLTPSYAWFDGTSEVYYLGEPLDGVPTKVLGDGSTAFVLGIGNGDVASPSAKIYPMKEHVGKLARHLASNTLVPHSTFEFFRTGDFGAAVRSGMEQTAGMSASDPYDVVAVHTFQTINHGVEDEDNALECSDCHGSTSRMDLQGELGYGLKGPERTVCTRCHEREDSMSFRKVHDKHVTDKQFDCAFCHTFTRPERGLRTSIRSSRDRDDGDND